MAARGVPVQNLPQEELHGRDRREQAIAPSGVPNFPAHCLDGFGWQQHGPLAGGLCRIVLMCGTI